MAHFRAEPKEPFSPPVKNKAVILISFIYKFYFLSKKAYKMVTLHPIPLTHLLQSQKVEFIKLSHKKTLDFPRTKNIISKENQAIFNFNGHAVTKSQKLIKLAVYQTVINTENVHLWEFWHPFLKPCHQVELWPEIVITLYISKGKLQGSSFQFWLRVFISVFSD